MTVWPSCARSAEGHGDIMAKRITKDVYRNVIVDAEEGVLFNLGSDEIEVIDICDLFDQLDSKCVTITVEYESPIETISVKRWD